MTQSNQSAEQKTMPVCPTGSVTDMWNEKAALAHQVEQLLKPFAHKWLIGNLTQIKVHCSYHGVSIEVTL